MFVFNFTNYLFSKAIHKPGGCMLVILGSWGRKVQNLRPAWAICSETVSKNPRTGDVVPPWVWSLNPVSKAAHTQSNVFFPEQVACRAGLTMGVPWFCLPSAAAFCPLSHAHPPPPVLRVWVSPWISPLVKEKGLTACSQPPLFLPELVLWPQGLRSPSQTNVLSCCLSWGNLGLTVWGKKHYRFLLTWNLVSLKEQTKPFPCFCHWKFH